MRTKEELKASLGEAVERHSQEIMAFSQELFHTPELGYKEVKTARLFAQRLASLGIEARCGLALTGVKARLSGCQPGPTVAVIGEMDALLCPDHPAADPQTGAAHACGHHAQVAQVYGVALGLVETEALKELAGSVVLFAVPAEEGVEIEYRLGLKERGQIEFLGGKQELIRLGEFDDIQMAISTHLSAHPEEKLPLIEATAGRTGNGFIAKRVRFLGRKCHVGSPYLGVNALSAARVALAAIDAQRETFKDEDYVRIHPIITKGGELVNIVPAEVVLETYVRAKTIEAIREGNSKLDRALKAGAMALGAEVEILDQPGYLPSLRNEPLARLFLDNIGQLIGPEKARLVEEHGGGSSDFGDLSHLMPVLQASVSGAKGRGHSPDYEIVDPQMAYIQPAKALAMTIVDLLYGEAQGAKELLASFQPPLSKEEYLKLLRGFNRSEHYSFPEGS